MNNQDNISSPKISNHNVMFPEKSNLSSKQDGDFKMVAVNMFKNPKKDLSESQNKTADTVKQNNENNSRCKNRI